MAESKWFFLSNFPPNQVGVITPALLITGFPGPPCVLPEFQYTYISISLRQRSIYPIIHPSTPKLLAEIRNKKSRSPVEWFNLTARLHHSWAWGKNDISSLKKKVPSHLKRCHPKLETIVFQPSIFRCEPFVLGHDSWKTTSGFLQGAAFYVNVQQ